MTNTYGLTIVLFLCGFLAHTNSQENLPNPGIPEDVLNKVSSVIDLGNLTSELNNINGSAITNALEEANNKIREKCEKNGGKGAYENAMNAKDNLEQCLKSFVNVTQLNAEMEQYKPTGDLDLVFKKYCSKTPTLKECISNFTTAVTPCLEPEEKETSKIIRNITDSLLNFVCYKEGDRIALFISANGPECLQSKQQEMQQCVDATFGSYASQIIQNANGSIPGLNSLPTLVLGTKECTDMSTVQACAVRELEKCSDPTPANIVDSIFNYIRRVTPCQTLAPSSSSTTISSLAITSIVLLVTRFV